MINKHSRTHSFVSLVGAGPGDIELLTLKAYRLIHEADVVVYDRLISDNVLELIPAGISKISVGKRPGHHCVPQSQINNIIVSLARSGRHVVRLKGGDPYLFGRGGEEILELRKHGINFEVVPGITAASGCSAYSGIPLTHRGLSHGVQFFTGHFRDGEELIYDWQKLASDDTTLVFYMALSNLEHITARLIEAGLSASTPAAAVQNGTTDTQKKLITTLGSLEADIKASMIKAPAIVIIGKVVSLSEELDWFQSAVDSRYNNESDDVPINQWA